VEEGEFVNFDSILFVYGWFLHLFSMVAGYFFMGFSLMHCFLCHIAACKTGFPSPPTWKFSFSLSKKGSIISPDKISWNILIVYT